MTAVGIPRRVSVETYGVDSNLGASSSGAARPFSRATTARVPMRFLRGAKVEPLGMTMRRSELALVPDRQARIFESDGIAVRLDTAERS
jgi:hypothetical protein